MPSRSLTSPRNAAIASMVLAGFLLSLNGIFVKNIVWTPVAIAAGRAFFAACIQLVIVGRPRFSFSRYQVAAALSIAVSITSFIGALVFTTVINAYALFYSIPVFLVLFSYFFSGEEPTRQDFLAVGLILIGSFIIFGQSVGGGGMLGNILAVDSAACWALGSLLIRKERGLSSDETSLLANMMVLLVCVPFVTSLPTIGSAGWMVACGAVGTGIPMLLFGRATKHLRSIEINLIAVLDLVLAPVWAFCFLKEVPKANVVYGSLIILSAVIYHAIVTARRSKQPLAS